MLWFLWVMLERVIGIKNEFSLDNPHGTFPFSVCTSLSAVEDFLWILPETSWPYTSLHIERLLKIDVALATWLIHFLVDHGDDSHTSPRLFKWQHRIQWLHVRWGVISLQSVQQRAAAWMPLCAGILSEKRFPREAGLQASSTLARKEMAFPRGNRLHGIWERWLTSPVRQPTVWSSPPTEGWKAVTCLLHMCAFHPKWRQTLFHV